MYKPKSILLASARVMPLVSDGDPKMEVVGV
jgi:hypothetical protein